ncbi:hypothetical protein [Streptomyces nanshensis]|uniref:DNA-binding protein n=1 Tax=Streptomyces nanshensis TaxID=518642 RepID=A0A1E7L580_9ACTN|nr:hypothetical protein [Streptomyces nanshensis]OEV11339.1 hypothetical protein AN218_13385 [Streptomyces nanshensis]
MPLSEPAKVPFGVSLSPAAVRVLAVHEPSPDTLLEAVLEQIASGQPPAEAPPVPYTGLVDPELLQRARHAVAEQGADLTEAIEQILRQQPAVLPPAHIARLLGVTKSSVTRALANNENAPGRANPDSDGKPLYDARAVCAWWPTRRHRGRPWPRSEDAS